MLDIKNPLVNEGRKPSNMFIIGNGFDLDLGLKTRFSDFANSRYWPSDIPNDENILTPLKQFLELYKNTEHWFDLERGLLLYAKDEEINKRGLSFPTIKPIIDVKYLQSIHICFSKYLKSKVKHKINNTSVAARVLDAVVRNGCFDNNYSFNYTDLNDFIDRLGIESHLEYRHIHGSLVDNSIIIGVDETPLANGFESFHKSRSPHYEGNNLYRQLLDADEVVFFGFSFSDIDYWYFEKYIQVLANKDDASNEYRRATIFTYDEKSRQSILQNFEKHRVNLSYLRQSKVDFIKTHDKSDSKKINEFIDRIKIVGQ